MTGNDDFENVLTDIQNCNINECINFDLTKTLEVFLNYIDKNIFEYFEKKESDEENEKEEKEKEKEKETDEKEEKDVFNSAGLFLENCVKIFGYKIEYLLNLAQNTIYNLYKENKININAKKELLTKFEEDYLFIHDVKNIKTTINEKDTFEEGIYDKTIPLPIFLFHENVKSKSKNKINEKDIKDDDNNKNKVNTNSKNDEKNTLEKITEFKTSQTQDIKFLNFDNIYLENNGIILLDINDYNVFIDDNNYELINLQTNHLFDKFDYCSKNSVKNTSKHFTNFLNDIKYKDTIFGIKSIEDLLSENICFDVILFKQNFNDYDMSLNIMKNKKNILKKFNEKNKPIHKMDEISHIDEKKDIILEKEHFLYILPEYYNIKCDNIKNYDYFFKFLEPNEIYEIIKENIELKILKQNNKNDYKDNVINNFNNNNINDNNNENENEKKYKLSNDEKIYLQIKIPELYSQKLNLNLNYYYLEPIIHNLIKEIRKKKNIDNFFSFNIDYKPQVDFDESNEEQFNEIKTEDNIPDDKKLTFTEIINTDINNNLPHVTEENELYEDLINLDDDDDDIQDRVNKWNDFLEKKLENLKKQPTYDIDIYKKNLVNYTINNGEKLSFIHLIKDNKSYEVCRNFLTTLMLINANVLEIHEIDKKKNSNDIINYEIKLKKDNMEQYLSPKNFKNTSFIIKDNKRKKNYKSNVTSKKNKKIKI